MRDPVIVIALILFYAAAALTLILAAFALPQLISCLFEPGCYINVCG